MLALMPGFGLGRASGALAGQNLGARKPERAVRSVWTSAAIYSAFMAACTVVSVAFPRFFIRLFTSDPGVISAGALYLRYVASVYLLIGLTIVLSKSMEGTGYTLVPMLLTMGALVCVMIPLALLLPKVLGIGIHGIWTAMVVAYSLHSVGAYLVFRLGEWKTTKIEVDYRDVAIPPQEPAAGPE
jgi:Na+-driven multidrug efflux pump